ncbi:TPA: hypothetical protein ACH3X1_010631 [Trebouxia sp. C0004]
MSEEQDKLKLKIEQAEAAAAGAQQAYDEAEPGTHKDSCRQLLLAEKASLLAKEKALEQVREKDLLQQRAAADPDLAARIAYLEEQRQLDDGLARKLYEMCSATQKAAYGKTVQGKLVCMLTSEALPSKTVIAAHLYKSSWAVFVELALGFSDIDDVRNGLLLWQPIEHAFDTAQLCFTYDTQTNSFVAQVLNSALLTEKLSSYGQRVMGASWAAPSSARAMTLTFADNDKAALSFPSGCEVRPYKRVLCYQAHLARREAAKQGWMQINFDDFWSEDEPYVAKVQHWLSKQTSDAYGE